MSPPSGYTPNAVKGSLLFIKTCYEDLLAEVRDGKHATYEGAIEHELSQIDKALTKLHIDSDGNLVQR